MALKSLFQYINIKRRKKPIAEEMLQAIQLSCNMAQEMRVIITSVHLINEILNKAELNLLKDRKILSFYPEEYEELCEILDSITIAGTHEIKTVDHILLLLRML